LNATFFKNAIETYISEVHAMEFKIKKINLRLRRGMNQYTAFMVAGRILAKKKISNPFKHFLYDPNTGKAVFT
jgi:predicted DNA-binding protein